MTLSKVNCAVTRDDDRLDIHTDEGDMLKRGGPVFLGKCSHTTKKPVVQKIVAFF